VIDQGGKLAHTEEAHVPSSIARYARHVPGSFRIARVLGIDVRVHISWVFIFALITFQQSQVFYSSYPSWSGAKSVVIATITALLFFTSVVVHELAHSVVARAFHMPVSSITLFLLGGVASLTKEPSSAKAEFLMAAAGPLTSLVIGGGAIGISELTAGAQRDTPQQVVRAVAQTLGWINVAVAVFNLIPGFPLDGGRVLRSSIWAIRGDRAAATRIAARGGQAVAALLVAWAAYEFFNGEPSGLWLGLIAYFLYGAASQTLQQERLTSAVGGVRVGQLMTTDFRSAQAGTSIASLVRDLLLPHNLRAVPVTSGERVVGLVTISDLRKVEQDQWPMTPIDSVMTKAAELQTVSPDDALTTALERFGNGELPLLPVIDHGSLAGVLYREAVLGYVRMREMLGLDPRR